MAAFVVALILLFVFTRRILLGTVLGITAAVGASVVLVLHQLRQHSGELPAARPDHGGSRRHVWPRRLWQFAIRKISERPWTGYGGYAGGRFVVLPGLGMPGKSDVLNTMVESFIDLGVLGVIVLLIVFVGIWWHLFRGVSQPSD